jgi:predicted nucleotidyltransferase
MSDLAATYSGPMGRAEPAKHPDDPLADAALNDCERRVIRRIVSFLQAELGADLLAVWLYGSRARGEADPNETHHDRRSDIDMIAIVEPSRDADAFSWELTPRVIEAADAEGDSPAYYSVHVYDADRLRNRRQIRSFFFQEVDRDKIVLAGSDLGDPRFK